MTTFSDDLKPFLRQMFIGLYTGPYRLNGTIIKDKNMIKIFALKYLNICWHGYYRDKDDFVIKSYDKLLSLKGSEASHKIIHNIVCLSARIYAIFCKFYDRMKDLDSILDKFGNLDLFQKELNLNRWILFKDQEEIDNNLDLMREYLGKYFDIIYSHKEVCDNLTTYKCNGHDNIIYDGKDLYS